MGVSGGMRTAKIYSVKEKEVQKPTWEQSKQFLQQCNPYVTGQLTIEKHYINYLENRPKGDYFQVSHSHNGIGENHGSSFSGFLFESRVVLAAHGYKCAECGTDIGCHSIHKKGNLELHHVIPLRSKKFRSAVKTDIANVVPLCRECHCKAHGKIISVNEMAVVA